MDSHFRGNDNNGRACKIFEYDKEKENKGKP